MSDTLELESHVVVSCLIWVLGPDLGSSGRTSPLVVAHDFNSCTREIKVQLGRQLHRETLSQKT